MHIIIILIIILLIRYLQEHCPLGTGGGIYHFRGQILSGNPSAFFVINCDVCCDFPVLEMYQLHLKTGACVILGTKVLYTHIDI